MEINRIKGEVFFKKSLEEFKCKYVYIQLEIEMYRFLCNVQNIEKLLKLIEEIQKG